MSLVGALGAIQPLLLPLVLLGYVPLWIVSSRNTRDLYRFKYGMAENDRARSYIEWLLVSRHSAAEVRAFALADFMRRQYDGLFDERIGELLEGRSVVLISHRFSSVRSADRIYVLCAGRIVEHGSHEELVAASGHHAELFSLQASAYLGSTTGG